MYRVLREGEAVPAGQGERAWAVLAGTGSGHRAAAEPRVGQRPAPLNPVARWGRQPAQRPGERETCCCERPERVEQVGRDERGEEVVLLSRIPLTRSPLAVACLKR